MDERKQRMEQNNLKVEIYTRSIARERGFIYVLLIGIEVWFFYGLYSYRKENPNIFQKYSFFMTVFILMFIISCTWTVIHIVRNNHLLGNGEVIIVKIISRESPVFSLADYIECTYVEPDGTCHLFKTKYGSIRKILYRGEHYSPAYNMLPMMKYVPVVIDRAVLLETQKR